MAHEPSARDVIESMIPVFCTAEIPVTTLNKFFEEANASTFRSDYREPQGFLMTADDLSKMDFSRPTQPLVEQKVLRSNPFVGHSPSQVAMWARVHLDQSELSPINIVVLDEKTPHDDTCLLVSLKDFPDENNDTLYVRSDFESSIITLKTKEMGCGGDEHFDGTYAGFDGVLRMSVRDQDPVHR